MSLRDQIIYSPLDVPLFNAYTFNQWSEWLDNHDDPSFYLYRYYKRLNDTYPWQQVNVKLASPFWIDLASTFPDFITYLSQLPVQVKMLRFIKQQTQLDGPWHSDMDEHNLGLRLCLEGNSETRTFKVCPFIENEVMNDELNKAPWIETNHGRVAVTANKLMDWNRVAKPVGIASGVTWTVTSAYGLHAVEKIDERRLQVIINYDPLPGFEELLSRSIGPDTILK